MRVQIKKYGIQNMVVSMIVKNEQSGAISKRNVFLNVKLQKNGIVQNKNVFQGVETEKNGKTINVFLNVQVGKLGKIEHVYESPKRLDVQRVHTIVMMECVIPVLMMIKN
ncbi:hypothetical protein IKI14_04710 [bacterium]|nr:hypothetical protein [bacterium]